jgi:hypothetical protein
VSDCGCDLDAEACACINADSGRGYCDETIIEGFAPDVTTSTSTGALTVTLSVFGAGTGVCTLAIGGGAPTTVDCNQALTPVPAPTATTTYTLSATGGGGTATAQTTVSCGPTSSPDADGGACPTGAVVYCEAAALSTTSSQQAEDACNACNGGGCTNDVNDPQLGGASAWMAPAKGGAVNATWYVYSRGSSAAGTPVCTSPYTIAAGDIIQIGAACGHSTW